jgi:luciferase family oxidoreductase group 1
MHYFQPAQSAQAVRAVPGVGLNIPLWILGSSLFGAQLAAQLGLPFAFASHFAPQQMMQAVALYRRDFQPSAQLAKPYVMLGFNVFAADSDSAAQFLASSMQQAFVKLRRGTPGQFPPPIDNFLANLPAADKFILDQVLSCSAIGSATTVGDSITTFIARTGADELMIASSIFDHQARLRSYEILAGIAQQIP